MAERSRINQFESAKAASRLERRVCLSFFGAVSTERVRRRANLAVNVPWWS